MSLSSANLPQFAMPVQVTWASTLAYIGESGTLGSPNKIFTVRSKSLGEVIGAQVLKPALTALSQVFNNLGRIVTSFDRAVTTFITFPTAEATTVEPYQHQPQEISNELKQLEKNCQTQSQKNNLTDLVVRMKALQTRFVHRVEMLALDSQAALKPLKDGYCLELERISFSLDQILLTLRGKEGYSSKYSPLSQTKIFLRLPTIDPRSGDVERGNLTENGKYFSLSKPFVPQESSWCDIDLIAKSEGKRTYEQKLAESIEMLRVTLMVPGELTIEGGEQFYSEENFEFSDRMFRRWEDHQKTNLEKTTQIITFKTVQRSKKAVDEIIYKITQIRNKQIELLSKSDELFNRPATRNDWFRRRIEENPLDAENTSWKFYVDRASYNPIKHLLSFGTLFTDEWSAELFRFDLEY